MLCCLVLLSCVVVGSLYCRCVVVVVVCFVLCLLPYVCVGCSIWFGRVESFNLFLFYVCVGLSLFCFCLCCLVVLLNCCYGLILICGAFVFVLSLVFVIVLFVSRCVLFLSVFVSFSVG